MFSCPFQQCKQTFLYRSALREHTKTHQCQVYWETLNRISEIFHNVEENIIKYSENENITVEDQKMENKYTNTNEDEFNEYIFSKVNEFNDINVGRNNINEIPSEEYITEDSEEPEEKFIHDYTLQTPEIIYQIISIDTRSISKCNISQFPDDAYADFMEL
ncbi:13538_t:CDS:2, partial [Funneliformis caledonium]